MDQLAVPGQGDLVGQFTSDVPVQRLGLTTPDPAAVRTKVARLRSTARRTCRVQSQAAYPADTSTMTAACSS